MRKPYPPRPRFLPFPVALAVVALAVTVIPRPAYPGQAQTPRTITVATLKGPSGIALARLFDRPPRASGVVFSIVASSGADVAAAKVMAGEFDAAVLPINVAAKLYTSGIPIRLVAILGNGMVSLLASIPGLDSLEALRGRQVFVAGQGATPDFVFRRILAAAGMTPGRDLRLTYNLSMPEAAAALASGKIQVAVLPEPFSTLARRANPSIVPVADMDALWKSATGMDSYPMTALVVSASLASKHPGTTAALLDACRDSIEWVIRNPVAAGTLVESRDLGMRADVAVQAIPRSNYVFVSAQEARASVEALLSVFLELAPVSIGGALPDGAFYAE